MHRRFTVMILLVLLAAACGDSGDASSSSTTTVVTTTVVTTTEATATTEATTTSETPPTSETPTTETPTTTGPTGSPLVITSVDFDEEWVEITNVSDSDYSLEGHFICNFPSYSSLAGFGTVTAGASFTVELSALNAGSASGEVGIYTASEFSNPEAMVTYVEWGTPNHARSGVAVEAGLWTAGDFVDNGRASFRAMTIGGSGADYELME